MQLNKEEMYELTLEEHHIMLALFGDLEDEAVLIERKQIIKTCKDCNKEICTVEDVYNKGFCNDCVTEQKN